MAIINCPGCSQKISSQAAICPHCGFQRGDVDPDAAAEFQRRQLRDKVYKLRMLSYVAITIFVIGFGWYWWDTSGFQQLANMPPLVVIAVGFIAYLVVRVLLFTTRRKQRELNSR